MSVIPVSVANIGVVNGPPPFRPVCNLPGGALCQIVLLDFQCVRVVGTGPIVVTPPSGWIIDAELQFGTRSVHLLHKVFGGAPVPASQVFEFNSNESTSIFISGLATAYDQVNPARPIDVSGAFRQGAASEMTVPSVNMTAALIEGFLVTFVRNNNAGEFAKDALQKVVFDTNPATTDAEYQDLAPLSGPGATGSRKIITTVAGESFATQAVLAPGPAAVAINPIPIETGYAYNRRNLP